MLLHQVREMKNGETVRFLPGTHAEYEQLLLDLVAVSVEAHVRVSLAVSTSGAGDSAR